MIELIAARRWLRVFRLPRTSISTSPVDSVWAHLKRSLASLTRHNIVELTAMVKTRPRSTCGLP